MRVLLTGGTGFIGRHLVAALIDRGDECVVISRSGKNPWRSDLVTVLNGDPVYQGRWQDSISGVDAVVNLAGELIVDPPKRWTSQRKQQLRSSRVSTTQNVVEGIRNAAKTPSHFLSGSAIGYYGSRGDEPLDESSAPGVDFLAELSREWEDAAIAVNDVVPVALLRTGIVLGTDGGALPSLLPSFRLGVGGPWGEGTQWWSWIHIEDQVGLILMVLDQVLEGPFNLTAPNPVTVEDFSNALGRALRRPTIIRTPAFALRIALGEAAAALLDLQRVHPKRAIEAGYRFRFPTVEETLRDLIRNKKAP